MVQLNIKLDSGKRQGPVAEHFVRLRCRDWRLWVFVWIIMFLASALCNRLLTVTEMVAAQDRSAMCGASGSFDLQLIPALNVGMRRSSAPWLREAERSSWACKACYSQMVNKTEVKMLLPNVRSLMTRVQARCWSHRASFLIWVLLNPFNFCWFFSQWIYVLCWWSRKPTVWVSFSLYFSLSSCPLFFPFCSHISPYFSYLDVNSLSRSTVFYLSCRYFPPFIFSPVFSTPFTLTLAPLSAPPHFSPRGRASSRALHSSLHVPAFVSLFLRVSSPHLCPLSLWLNSSVSVALFF